MINNFKTNIENVKSHVQLFVKDVNSCLNVHDQRISVSVWVALFLSCDTAFAMMCVS